MTELSTLERKRLSDLHQIASQLGIKQYRKYRKPELAEMIYKVATEQAASQQNETTTNGGATANVTREAPVTTDGPNGATETPVAPVDGFGAAAATVRTAVRIAVRSSGATGTARAARRTCRAESSMCCPTGSAFSGRGATASARATSTSLPARSNAST